MPDTIQPSPIQQARKRMAEARRQEAATLAKLRSEMEATQIKGDQAKRIAATLMEMMKR
ncbi:hypothetical protein [Thiocystis violacea]|uniref:hypothetical protein n=1 Tax=Thiocystis violacea TaxID=13725 RepID=UPI001907B55C|nr:hypothetical protein [Thiocystis violacea]